MGAFFKSRNNDILIYINFKSLFLNLLCILSLLLYSYKYSFQKNGGTAEKISLLMDSGEEFINFSKIRVNLFNYFLICHK